MLTEWHFITIKPYQYSRYLIFCVQRNLDLPLGYHQTNSLVPMSCSSDFKKYDFHCTEEWRGHSFRNCSQVNNTKPHWWYVNIGSDNGLVLRQEAIMRANVDAELCRHIASVSRNGFISNHIFGSQCCGYYVGVLLSWWHHQMETFFELLALCEGNPPVTGGFPHKGL